jgi:hypothetical protein
MKEALDATLLVIKTRARLYRSTVVAVVTIGVLSGLAAAAFRSWFPLSAVILVVPVSGTFCVLDGRLVRGWRRRILELRSAQDLDLTAFVKTISAHPMVPQQTFQGMLVSLPATSVGGRLASSSEQRTVIVGGVEVSEQRQEVRSIVGTAALTGLLTCLAAAARFRSGWLVLGALGLLVIWVGSKKL